MHLILWGSSWTETHARGAQICYRYVRVPWRLAFWRGECLYHRPLGVRLFGESNEYMKNSVPWERIHLAGPLEWCQWPRVHRKPRRRQKSVSPFLSMFWGGVPLFVIRPKIYHTPKKLIKIIKNKPVESSGVGISVLFWKGEHFLDFVLWFEKSPLFVCC